MKQVDFDIRINTVSASGNNGSFTHDQLVEVLKKQHPYKDGWEIKQIEYVQNSADGIVVATLWVKYADA